MWNEINSNLKKRLSATLIFNAKVETVDIMKIDIEGYEIKVIPHIIALLNTWPKTKWPRALLFDMDSMLIGHPGADFEGENKHSHVQ